MLSPSKSLTELLTELQLCSAQQLAACEPEVRRLAGDLPGFDLCWLDVLVAHRLLTPWQAECLQSDDPLEMRQGPYRLREPLGARTWQAETPDRRRLVVLSQLTDSDDQVAKQLSDRAQSLVADVAESPGLLSSSICLPRELLQSDAGGGWLVSPYVPGWRLDELLIRGGRLPWRVVVEIGRTVLQGLHQLHQADLCHGDISLRNIRLQPGGRAELVDPFTARLLQPSVGYRADLKLRDVQHCAPEIVGNGRRTNAMSDLYSLGTVLWQLLTGRPTFISADPVTFLMKCRDQDVDDVRRWVPDCPERVALEILRLTRRRPELRPDSTADALKSWSQLAGHGSSATSTLLKRMPDRRRTDVAIRPTISRRILLRGTLAAAAVTGCVMVGLSGSLIPLPLNLSRTSTTEVTSVKPTTAEETFEDLQPVAESLPLPDPSADGHIDLLSGQRYDARSLRQPGAIRIRAKGDSVAVIEVSDQSSWTLVADQIQLSGVEVRCSEGDPRNATLLDVRCRVLELDRMVIGLRGTPKATGVRWTPSAEGSTVARISNSVFAAGRFGIHTTSAPQHFVMQNVLFESVETAWRCDADDSTRAQLNINQVTQRGGSSFADVIHRGSAGTMQVDLTCGESVLVPGEAILRLASSLPDWTPEKVSLAFRLPGRANPVIIPPQVHPAVWFDRSLKQKVAVADSHIVSESLLMAETEFHSSGSDGPSFESARLVDFDGPKRGQQLPGVDVTQLPEMFFSSDVTGGK